MVSVEKKNSKSDRIVLHSKELYRNLREWAELKIQLILFEFRESAWNKRKQICLALFVCFLLAVSVIFLLFAAALWLGILFNNVIWGLLVISGMMLLTSWLIYQWGLKPSKTNLNKTDQQTSFTHGESQ